MNKPTEKNNEFLTFSLRLSIWVWEPIITTFFGKFSSLIFKTVYESELPTMAFSMSFTNNINGAILLSFDVTYKHETH